MAWTRALLVSTLLLVGCGDAAGVEQRDRAMAVAPLEHRIAVLPFRAIRVTGPDDVSVSVGSRRPVRVAGPEHKLGQVTAYVLDEELRIGAIGPRSRPTLAVMVTSPRIESVTMLGSGSLSVRGMRGPRLSARISGSGDLGLHDFDVDAFELFADGDVNVVIVGRARRATLRLRGSADVQAENFTVADLRVRSSGANALRANASGTADVAAAGTPNIRIAGPARCRVSGGDDGWIRCGTAIDR